MAYKNSYEKNIDRIVKRELNNLEKLNNDLIRADILEKRTKLKVLDILFKHFSIKYERPYDDNFYSYILESIDTGATFHIHLNKQEHYLFKLYLEESKKR